MYERDEPYASIVAGRYDGLDPDDLPRLTADAPIRPDGPYGIGKAFGEAAARYYAEEFGLSVICLRIGTVNAREPAREPAAVRDPAHAPRPRAARAPVPGRAAVAAVRGLLRGVGEHVALLGHRGGSSGDRLRARGRRGALAPGRGRPVANPSGSRSRLCVTTSGVPSGERDVGELAALAVAEPVEGEAAAVESGDGRMGMERTGLRVGDHECALRRRPHMRSSSRRIPVRDRPS